MKRLYVNMLAAVTILVGAWIMASPSPVLAGNSACCFSGPAICCGNYCIVGEDSCAACDNPEDCQL